MGAWVAERSLLPDLIVSSTALRARGTAAEVARTSGCDGPVVLSEDLYMAGPAAIVEKLRAAPETCETVMVVGHNPGVEDLASLLAGRDVVMPTAALAHIRLDIDCWHQLTMSSRGELVEHQKPRELRPSGGD